MTLPKYKRYFNRMFEENKELFQRFMLLCQDYKANPKQYKRQFDKEGKKIIEIVREWEDKLCAQMERGGHGRYSARLSDKFWKEVRRYFPPIDEVGAKISFDGE